MKIPDNAPPMLRGIINALSAETDAQMRALGAPEGTTVDSAMPENTFSWVMEHMVEHLGTDPELWRAFVCGLSMTQALLEGVFDAMFADRETSDMEDIPDEERLQAANHCLYVHNFIGFVDAIGHQYHRFLRLNEEGIDPVQDILGGVCITIETEPNTP